MLKRSIKQHCHSYRPEDRTRDFSYLAVPESPRRDYIHALHSHGLAHRVSHIPAAVPTPRVFIVAASTRFAQQPSSIVLRLWNATATDNRDERKAQEVRRRDRKEQRQRMAGEIQRIPR